MRPRIETIRETVHTGVDNHDHFRGAPTKTIVFEAATPPQPAVEVPVEANAAERNYEGLRAFNPPVEPLGFYFLTDAVVRGRGFVLVDEHLLDAGSLIPGYIRHLIDTGQQMDAEPEPARIRRSVPDPVAVIAGDSHLVYGHWLVDILPRAWMLRTRLGELVPGLRIALPSDTPAYALDILDRLFGLERSDFVFFDMHREELIAAKLIVPSLLHRDHAFHPAMNLFVDDVRAKLSDDMPTDPSNALIYVSRHKFRDATTSYRRTISNEPAVMDLVRGHGFTVVCPEDLSWPEQIRLFARARVIVGESGSALHNTLFSDRGAVVLCIRPVNQVQATIAALREQTVYFFCPEEERQVGAEVAYAIDIARLDVDLRRCKAIAAAQDA